MILLLTYFSRYKLKLLTPAASTPATRKAKLLILFTKCENEEGMDKLHIWKNFHQMQIN